MGRCCNWRCFLLTICVLQLVFSLERQVFDFLGFMWTCVLGNFLNVIATILGFFGACQYRTKYVGAYAVWLPAWVAWNAFVVCFYLNVGSLDRDSGSSALNLGTGSRSWWQVNGPRCVAFYNLSLHEEPWNRKPIRVEGCLVDYQYVETVQASTHILLAVLGFLGAIFVIRQSTEEDSSLLPRSKSRTSTLQMPYSIEFQRPSSSSNNGGPSAVSDNYQQRPLTPRRVKRRSTRSRNGTLGPASLTSSRNGSTTGSLGRGHNAPSGAYKNPVTKLMDRSVDSSTSNDSFSHPPPPYHPPTPSLIPGGPSSSEGRTNQGYLPSRPSSSAAQHHGLSSLQATPQYGGHSYEDRPSPIYYNMNDSETVI